MTVDVFRTANLDPAVSEIQSGDVRVLADRGGWNEEEFACEQIRGLVRQVFFSSVTRPVRQVLFAAAEGNTDMTHLCRRVGEALALEIKGSVAVLGRDVPLLEEGREEAINPTASQDTAGTSGTPVKDAARKAKSNLWLLTESLKSRSHGASTTSLYSRLCALRAEFDYSIVEGALAGGPCEAAALGQLTDGIVLVLAAHKTRRAAALRFKETLETARTRLLGSVLCERTFPIPDVIYRRL
jgi:hypothetical protein